jgi:hypothetical protein
MYSSPIKTVGRIKARNTRIYFGRVPYKACVLIMVFAISMTFIGAQDSVAELDAAIARSDYDMIDLLLQTAASDLATRYELKIVEAAKAALFANRLDDASRLAEIVLLFNLDNITAQDIYTGVEDAKRQQAELDERKRLAEAEAVEQQRLLELQRRRDAQIALFRENLSFFAAVTPLGVQGVYSQFAEKYAASQRQTYAPQLAYGTGLELTGRFRIPQLLLAVGVSLDWLPPLNDSAGALDWSAGLHLGFPRFTGPLVAHFAYVQSRLVDPVRDPVLLYHTLAGPVIGLGLRDWWLGEAMALQLGFDWKALSFLNPLIGGAFSAEAGLRWLLLEFSGHRQLYLDTLFKGDGLWVGEAFEMRLRLHLSVVLSVNNRRIYD